jgi:hypothetical protein
MFMPLDQDQAIAELSAASFPARLTMPNAFGAYARLCLAKPAIFV